MPALKSHSRGLAIPIAGFVLVLATAPLACTQPNPAFRAQVPAPASDRRDARAPDVDAASEPAQDATSSSEGDASGADLLTATTIDASDAAAPDSPLAVGLAVRYPLDLVAGQDVTDATGTRIGSMHGGSGWTSMGFPRAQFSNGGALVLDGTSGYVTLPAAGLPTVAGNKTVSLWFWQPAPNNSLRKTLIAISNREQAVGFNIGLQGGVPSVWVWRQLIGTALVAGPQASPAGWTHMAFVQQGSAARLYLNGALVDTAGNVAQTAPITLFMLGGYDATEGQDERWNGRLDEVRVYGRALSTPEIEALAAGAL